MWTNRHPYLFIYVVGCIASLICFLVGATIVRMLYWFTKADVMLRNIRKLVAPDHTFLTEVTGFLSAMAVTVALSWIGVITELWGLIKGVLGLLREVFSSTPEAIKVLTFPLKNNRDMPPESVWAYWKALDVKRGAKQPTDSELLAMLNEPFDKLPSFDRRAALKQLESLNAINSDVIGSALSRLPILNQV